MESLGEASMITWESDIRSQEHKQRFRSRAGKCADIILIQNLMMEHVSSVTDTLRWQGAHTI